MKLTNTSSLPTEELRRRCYEAAKWFGISLKGTLVQVHNGYRSRYSGKCWGTVDAVYRKGNRIPVNGYIKLFVHKGKTIDDAIATFVHELSHLEDAREFTLQGKKIPYGQEKRARFLEEKYRKDYCKEGSE